MAITCRKIIVIRFEKKTVGLIDGVRNLCYTINQLEMESRPS